MTLQTLLRLDPPPLTLDVTAGDALRRLTEAEVAHLAVVDDEGLLNFLLSEEDLLDSDPTLPVGVMVGLGRVAAEPQMHWYEAASLMARHHLSLLPVVDANGRYLGVVHRSDLFERFAGSLSTGSAGAVLTLQVPAEQFSMSQLIHLVEQNGARVLSVSTQGQEQGSGDAGSMPVEVTIKLNTTDTARIRHVLEHYGYPVTSAHGAAESDEAFNYRLAEFLRYLEV